MQDLVLGNLSVAIESQLLNSVNVLRDSYMGVLQRCLEHLEDVDQGADLGSTSQALKEVPVVK
jgi:receptor-interacting serine/threonine-protein kinase 5